MNRKRIVVALWLVAVAVALALLFGPGRLWNRKSHHESPVAAYLTRVDRLEQQMRPSLKRLLDAYRGFSTSGKPREQAKVADAERTLARLERRLAALPAPADAAKLKRLLGGLVADEHGIAVEIEQLGAFMPRFHVLTGLAAVANARLARTLAAASPPKAHAVRGTAKQIAAERAAYAAAARRAQAAQADAVDEYDRVLVEEVRALRKLTPPPVMAPAYRAEVHTLESTARAGAALSAELRKSASPRVPLLSRRFDEAARISGGDAAQLAEIAAVKAYNTRVRGIAAAQTKVQLELGRLQRLSR